MILLGCTAALALPAPAVQATAFHAAAVQAEGTGNTLYVKPGGAKSGSCSSWAAACDLQYALSSVAQSGDELWVAAGTYKPTTGTDRNATFQLKSGVALYGGFDGEEEKFEDRDWVANVTVLSGNIGAASNVTDNVYHVVTGSGTDGTAVLDGFTVTGGYTGNQGGGMLNENGSPTITNVTFRDNFANHYGGGMYNANGSSPKLTNVTFSSNTTYYDGGGMYNTNSSPELTNVTFSGNTSYYYGGGMYNTNSSPELTNVTFSGNTASTRGGGMANIDSSSPVLTGVTFNSNSAKYGGGMANIDSSSPTLANVTFSGNYARLLGGGMYNSESSSPTLTNVTFSGNTTDYYGGGMINESNSDSTIHNTIFWGNMASAGPQIYRASGTVEITNSIIQGGCPLGIWCSSVLNDNPLLGTLGDWGGVTQTIPLLPGSPAIDAGNDNFCLPTDQRGVSRHGAHCDIGAYESRGFILAKTSGDGQSATINTPFPTPLGVRVSSEHNEPVDGGAVTFSAPATGASAAPALSEVAIDQGAASLALTANEIPGAYLITADTAGAAPPVSFHLTNLKADTRVELTSSANPSVWGQPVTLTAEVIGQDPGGMVSFIAEDGAPLAGCQDIELVGGKATCTITPEAVGAHAITGEYSGDTYNIPASGALTLEVIQAAATIAISSSANPASSGSPLTVTVTVSAAAPGSGVPTGQVTLYEAATSHPALAAQSLVNGAVTFTIPPLSPGKHTLLAVYSGDEHFAAGAPARYDLMVNAWTCYIPFTAAWRQP